jgi:hypothetical protein
VAERDPPLGEIVGGEFHSDAIASQNADAIAPEPSREMRENDAFMLELYAEQTAGKFFENGAGYFDAVFFAQSNSFLTNSTDR